MKPLLPLFYIVFFSNISFCQINKLTLVDTNAAYSFLGAYNEKLNVLAYRKASEDISKGAHFVSKNLDTDEESLLFEEYGSHYVDWFDSSSLLIQLIEYGIDKYNNFDEGLYLLNPFTGSKERLSIPIQELGINSYNIYTDNRIVYITLYDPKPELSKIYAYRKGCMKKKLFYKSKEIISDFAIDTKKERFAYWSYEKSNVLLKVFFKRKIEKSISFERAAFHSGNLLFVSDEDKLYYHYFADSCSSIMEVNLIDYTERFIYKTNKGYKIDNLSSMGENTFLLSIINHNPHKNEEVILNFENATIQGYIQDIKLYSLQY